MSIRYAPGPAFALVRPGLVVVVDSTVSVRTVARVWDALETVAPSDGMAVVLDAVTTVLDPTWRALPAFSIVALTPSVTGVGDAPVAAHVASRGELAVQLRTPEGDVSVAGRGVTTWVENQFVDVQTITLGPGGDDAEDDVLTIVDGVVGICALTWQVAPGGATVTVEDEPSEAVPVEDEQPVGPGSEPERESEPAALSESEPAVSLEAEPQPERAAADDSAPVIEPVGPHEPGPVPVVDLEPEPEPEPIDAVGLPEAELRELEFGRTLAEFPEDWRPGGADVPEPTPESDGVPVGRRLLHAEQADAPEHDGEPLVALSVPAGAPSEPLEQDVPREDPGTERTLTADEVTDARVEGDPDEDLDDSTILSTAGSAVPVPVPSRAVSVAPSAVAPPPPALPTVASTVGPPGLPPVPPPPPSTDAGYGYGPSTQSQPTLQQAPHPSSSGAGGYGVVASQPQAQTAPVAPSVSAPTGPPPKAPEILARSCFFGHANPPVRMTCSQCGGGLSPNAQLVERPSLGRVRFSHGEVVELVQPVVVGRFPMPQSQQGMAPRLVTVVSPSQDVSRSHLEVRLEGWHVLLVDLDTVNGTTLRRAGQAPRRLHPHEPTLITEGDVVDLGDGVLLSFEGIA